MLLIAGYFFPAWRKDDGLIGSRNNHDVRQFPKRRQKTLSADARRCTQMHADEVKILKHRTFGFPQSIVVASFLSACIGGYKAFAVVSPPAQRVLIPAADRCAPAL
jgi:hypothetical protein